MCDMSCLVGKLTRNGMRLTMKNRMGKSKTITKGMKKLMQNILFLNFIFKWYWFRSKLMKPTSYLILCNNKNLKSIFYKNDLEKSKAPKKTQFSAPDFCKQKKYQYIFKAARTSIHLHKSLHKSSNRTYRALNRTFTQSILQYHFCH